MVNEQEETIALGLKQSNHGDDSGARIFSNFAFSVFPHILQLLGQRSAGSLTQPDPNRETYGGLPLLPRWTEHPG